MMCVASNFETSARRSIFGEPCGGGGNNRYLDYAQQMTKWKYIY